MQGGFTLLEALIAMTLSIIVVMLVTSVFMVQNRFYGEAVKRTEIQETVRAVTELVSGDVRAATLGSVVVATEDRLVIRSPAYMGLVCGLSGSNADIHLASNGEPLDTAGLRGYAVRDTLGSWGYYVRDWDALHVSTGSVPAANCFTAGADTVGATGEFHRLEGPGTTPAPAPELGWPILLYREIEFEVAGSGLEGGELGFYRGYNGEDPLEFATGITSGTHFEYRMGSDSYVSTVSGSDRDLIDGIRLHVGAETEGPSGESEEMLEFSWTVDIPLRNAR